jgi:DNA-binding MarR family transcriptional regulator
VDTDIIEIAGILKHPRRLQILMIIVNNPQITAKEILEKIPIKVPQYLYSDIDELKNKNLITRTFSEEKGVLTYRANITGLIIDFKTMTMEEIKDE